MLNESDISELINKSGRLRMLSHRSGMLITLLTSNHEFDAWFEEELIAAIDNFKQGYLAIEKRVSQEGALQARFIEHISRTEGRTSAKDTIHYYLTAAPKLLSSISNGGSISDQSLAEFLKFISIELLAALNSLVAFFEGQLIVLASTKSDKMNSLLFNIKDSLEEVEKINMSIKILSFNASAEAARAGAAGAGFSVIAGEMNRLNTNTRDVVARLNSDVSLFIEAFDR